jgi:predicted nucleic acid-binding protein
MIFVDANYILRYLVQATTPAQRLMAEQARWLFEAVQRGEEEITTTEVVLHEVAYVLASKANYNLPAAEIATTLRVLLQLPGFKLPRGQKRTHLRALDLYTSHPKLGLADAIIAATAERQAIPLATFDSHFDDLPTVPRWQPPTATAQP